MKAQYYALLVASFAATSTSSATNCRCLYGQPCWPSESAFTTLSAQLSQPLLKPLPPASPCYHASSSSNNCTDVSENFFDGFWRSDQPGAEQNVNFETYRFRNGTISACYFNVTLGFPCEQGGIPPIGVDARVVGDVQAAVAFAAKYNLRLVVKNTGHDLMGRSSARGGFLLWMHHLKDIAYTPSFVPDGAPANETYNAVTLGAGVQFNEVYEAVQQHGRVFVGGACPSVGPVGGWVMGGGHSALSPRHGLGVDNVIQFKVVTANGTYLTANAYQNQDLFWALRGGGGGTYGVVTSATYLTHPTTPLIVSSLTANFSSVVVAKTVLTEFVRLHPTFAGAGWGGYASISAERLDISYFSPNTSWSDTNATMLPFFDFVRNATDGDMVSDTQPYDSFYALYKTAFSDAGGVGFNAELSSRLMSTEMAEKDPGGIAQVMVDVARDGAVLSFVVVGGAVSQPDPQSMGLNPAWRKALGHMYIATSWADGSSMEDIDRLIQDMKDRTQILDRLSVDSASYLNEGSMHEVDFQKTFFGEHYQKLESIKKKYDPRGMFIVTSGVGSEEWDHDLNCRL